MSVAEDETLKVLTKRLGKLVLEAKSGRKDKKLKGLLVQLKTEVLRNAKAATSFRDCHGLHFLYNIIEHHPSVRHSVLAVTCGLLANLTTLDNATKQHVCLRKNLNFIVEIMEQAPSADAVNCASRLLGNVAADIGLAQNPLLASRISKALVNRLSSILQANSRQSLLRTVRHLVLIPICKAELLRLDVIPQVCHFLEADHEELTNATFQCLEALHVSDTEVIIQLARVSQLPLLVKGVTSTEPATTRTAINILLACGRLPECRANLGSSGAVRTLIQLLVEGERRESEVRRDILKVLCLCCHDVLCRRKMKIHNGMSVLVTELKSGEYGVNDSIVRLILHGIMCYYFDDQTLRFMVVELDLAKVLGGRVKELVAAMRASKESGGGGGEGDSVDGNATCSLVPPASQSTAVAADSTDFSCSSSFQGSEPSSSRSTSTQSSGSSSRSATPVDASCDVAVVPVADTYSQQAPGSPEWSVPTGIFESMLEDIAMSPPVPHPSRVQGVPCGSPEGFVVTPPNIIDQLLTAPSPYSSPSPVVGSFQRPETAAGSPSGASTPDAGHPLLALVSRLSFLVDCLPSLAQEDLVIPLVDYLATAGHKDNSKCCATLTRIFRNNHCLSPCVVALVAPRVWHLPTGGNELLKCLSSVATTSFGVGILANMLRRGSSKERTATALSIPFICPDQKVLHKLLVAYGGFTTLSGLILQQQDAACEEHPLFGTALEALSALWGQACQMQHPGPAAPFTSAAAASSPGQEEAPSTSSDTPPCKKARIAPHESDSQSCCYSEACQLSPPDVNFAVTGPSVPSDEDHAVQEEDVTAVALFPAHRKVMGGASDVFATLLCGSFREASEDVVRLLEVEPSSFEILLHHTYGCRDNCKHMSAYAGEAAMGDYGRSILSRVLAMADRYILVELLNDTEKSLIGYVTPTFVLELFALATLHRAQELQRSCLKCIFDASADFSIEMGRKLIAQGLMPAALEVFQQLLALQ